MEEDSIYTPIAITCYVETYALITFEPPFWTGKLTHVYLQNSNLSAPVPKDLKTKNVIKNSSNKFRKNISSKHSIYSVPGPGLDILKLLAFKSLQQCQETWGVMIIPIVQMRKQRHGDSNRSNKTKLQDKQKTWDTSPGNLTLEPLLLTTLCIVWDKESYLKPRNEQYSPQMVGPSSSLFSYIATAAEEDWGTYEPFRDIKDQEEDSIWNLLFWFVSFTHCFLSVQDRPLHQQKSRNFSEDKTCRLLKDTIFCKTHADRLLGENHTSSVMPSLASGNNLFLGTWRQSGWKNENFCTLTGPAFIPAWPLPSSVAGSRTLGRSVPSFSSLANCCLSVSSGPAHYTLRSRHQFLYQGSRVASNRNQLPLT